MDTTIEEAVKMRFLDGNDYVWNHKEEFKLHSEGKVEANG